VAPGALTSNLSRQSVMIELKSRPRRPPDQATRPGRQQLTASPGREASQGRVRPQSHLRQM